MCPFVAIMLAAHVGTAFFGPHIHAPEAAQRSESSSVLEVTGLVLISDSTQISGKLLNPIKAQFPHLKKIFLICFLSLPKDMLIDFRERGKEGEKHQCLL